MPRTIECPECGTALKLPSDADGRRVRCPKCSGRFRVGSNTALPVAPPGAESDRGPSSTILATASLSQEGVPVMVGSTSGAIELPVGGESGSLPAATDLRSLFKDDGPPVRRRDPARDRAQTRRCPSCSGIVPAGMSLCQRCGLDLETGRREVDPLGLDEPVPAPRHALPPLGILIAGGTALLASSIASLWVLVHWQRGLAGAPYFLVICLFAVFASVQFLRGKSAKLLLMALSLGALIDLVGLIALPIYRANTELPVVAQSVAIDPDAEPGIAIASLTERFDLTSIKWGISLLLLYAAACVYLWSPAVRRHMRRSPAELR